MLPSLRIYQILKRVLQSAQQLLHAYNTRHRRNLQRIESTSFTSAAAICSDRIKLLLRPPPTAFAATRP
jgi:hypothetical protein